MSSSNTYLSLETLEKRYGTFVAVDRIDLSIAQGEFVSFLGPSGSGKTTTLMMIAGFDQPTGGRIGLDGDNLLKQKSWQRDIGVVFQNYALFPHMTVSENIGFPLRMRNVSKFDIVERVRRMVDMVGLSAHAEKYPKALSGGQQQRVALARGLIFNPRLLLLDEPLGALDKRLREQMQLEIKRIHEQLGVTMIYVTHDQSEAMTMADRIAVFNNGRIEQCDAPLSVYNRPKTNFVADFIGESNILNGKVLVPETGLVELDGLGQITLSADRTAGFVPGAASFLLRPEWITPVRERRTTGDVLNIDGKPVEIVNHGGSALVNVNCGKMHLLVRVASYLLAEIENAGTITLEIEPRWIRPIESAT
jgi:putative spermidine/putrescine transport system ATP-binding protein